MPNEYDGTGLLCSVNWHALFVSSDNLVFDFDLLLYDLAGLVFNHDFSFISSAALGSCTARHYSLLSPLSSPSGHCLNASETTVLVFRTIVCFVRVILVLRSMTCWLLVCVR